MRFQQLSAPVMAKGVEDTAFYTFCRFVALNEVGGSPGAFGTAVAGFHAACEEAAREWPQSLLASSTHDTKRSEDVRARLFLLSEIPQRWGEAVRRWSALADRHRTDGRPDANIEYLLWQTMVGAHPLSLDRALTYVEKASREAKTHTSWIDPQPAYDTALRRFVEGVYADRALLDDVASFAEPLVAPGRVNSLAQTLVKLTAPGVPDIYQGCELWDLSLVDPDNRRPVDFGHRRALLEAVGRPATTAADTWADADSGAPKLFLTHRALAVRQARPHAFDAKADYVPLAVQGRAAPHVVAFARGGEVATVVPRLVLGLHGEWGDTTVELPPGRWRDELGGADHDGGHVRMDELLAEFPVALLVRRP
jgi:(1->4)-alpha-D-glucan 1-alpha-D-glucosylmutase